MKILENNVSADILHIVKLLKRDCNSVSARIQEHLTDAIEYNNLLKDSTLHPELHSSYSVLKEGAIRKGIADAELLISEANSLLSGARESLAILKELS